MALRTDTKFTIIEGTTYILVPKEIVRDSQYSFNENDLLSFEIVENKITITKKGENENNKQL